MEFSIQDQNQGRKMTGMMFAAMLHAALIWGLVNGLGWTKVQIIPQSIPVTIPKEDLPKPVEPPPPTIKPLDIKPVKIDFVPPVEKITETQPDTERTIKDTTAVEPEYKDGGGLVRDDGDKGAHGIRTLPMLNAQACDKPDYPSRELRNGVEGTTVLQLLIGTNGKVVDSKVARSSGSAALDKAALAGLTRCPFKAAMVDGKPEAAWTKVQYVWRIEQE